MQLSPLGFAVVSLSIQPWGIRQVWCHCLNSMGFSCHFYSTVTGILTPVRRVECPSVYRERDGWVLGLPGTCRDPYSSMTIPCKLAALIGREWLEQSPPNAPPAPRHSPQSSKAFSTIFHITAGAESRNINMKGLSGLDVCFPRTCPDIPNVL